MKRERKMSETEKFLVWFTKREDELSKQIAEKNLVRPTRLMNWQLWIGDPVMYINELDNFVKTAKV